MDAHAMAHDFMHDELHRIANEIRGLSERLRSAVVKEEPLQPPEGSAKKAKTAEDVAE